MKIVTLTDNRASDSELKTEHGLSVYIETENHKVLFDTGQSALFAQNADKLGIDLQQIDLVVISHGHYDHIGGLRHFLEMNHHAKVILKREIFDYQYQSVKAGTVKQIGADPMLLDYQNRFIFPENNLTSIDSLQIIKEIEIPYPQPKGNKLLFKSDGEVIKEDNFEHELLFVIENNDKLVIFTGCAHHGVLNMIHTAKQHFPGKTIQLIYGGFHLIDPNSFTTVENNDELENIRDTINSMTDNETIIFTGHCTGNKVLETLTQVMGDKIKSIYTGLTINL